MNLFDLPDASPPVSPPASGDIPPASGDIPPPSGDHDPFEALAGDPSELKVQGEPEKFGHQVRAPKTLDSNLGELLEHGDPEQGGGRKKKPKPVDHGPRTAEFMRECGYAVTKLEHWQILRSGFGIKIDLHGLWDYLGAKDGEPPLYAQACSDKGEAQHLRDMTSDKRAWDNKETKIENLLWHLDQGHRCVLVVWTRQDNGRYKGDAPKSPRIVKITRALVEGYISRKRR